MQVAPHTACLAHLDLPSRADYLATLMPSADVDHRGTAFTPALLSELLDALTDPATDRPTIGNARFTDATLDGDAVFDSTVFEGQAEFIRARFDGEAHFRRAAFGSEALFEGAHFTGDVVFDETVFRGGAWFARAEMRGKAVFGGVKFDREASFLRARFSSLAWFSAAQFRGETWFHRADFRSDAVFSTAALEHVSTMGPLICAGTLDLSEATFGAPVTIEVAARAVNCRRTRWVSTAALRLRHAAVDLSDAVMERPVSVAARSRSFTTDGETLAEVGLPDSRVGVVSLRGADTAHLVLTDVDLSQCRFAGAIHLDQLRLEGLYTLATTPPGVRRIGMRVMRWTPRRTLIDEHHWRASRSISPEGWTAAPEGEETLEPAALAPVYRQLRKSFEDGKHEPGAADFYYGEMEMRRHADDIPWAERALLTTYWVLSGYGLRASRAFMWLLTAMAATLLAMVLWGLPQHDPTPGSTGTLSQEGKITLITTSSSPASPTGPYQERLSAERLEKSLRVVINSVVFRSSGQNLTTTGTYIEMTSRLSEPVLLGLAAFAIRNRVKR